MLSEDEKEAIEQFKGWREYIIKHRKETNQANDLEFYIRTILNLITRFKKENEYWKNRIEKGKKDVIGLKLYEMGIVCEDLQEELKEKDKQIDLMAEHIVSSAIVDDTVCAIKCDCESDILEDCSHEKMLNCTKEYFKRKATNIG